MQASRALLSCMGPMHGAGRAPASRPSLQACRSRRYAHVPGTAFLFPPTLSCARTRGKASVASPLSPSSTAPAAPAASVRRSAGKTPACLSTSPARPDLTTFRLSATPSLSTTSPPAMVLHTGFRAEAGGDGALDAPSFEVVSMPAFERLLAEALASVPAESSAREAAARALEEARSPAVAQRTAGEPGGTASDNHLTRELQRLVRDVDEALAPLLAAKAPLDRVAYQLYYPLLKYSCFALLAAQFAVYFNWIFFVFDWNLVEPTTYFIGYTGVFCALVYHYIRCDAAPDEPFTWRNMFVYLARRKARSLYARRGLDTDRIAELERTRRAAVAALAKYQ